eukprot:1717236-Lingulodinium_polyedra.AAC.1
MAAGGGRPPEPSWAFLDKLPRHLTMPGTLAPRGTSRWASGLSKRFSAVDAGNPRSPSSATRGRTLGTR